VASSVLFPCYYQLLLKDHSANLRDRLQNNTSSYRTHSVERQHDQDHLLASVSTSYFVSICLGTSTKYDFFAYQTNGAIGLLMKLLGTIDPTVLLKWASILTKSVEGTRVVNTAGTLKYFRLYTAIYADLR
jgi:hypothetical protein